MFKIVDRLLIKSFIGPFIVTFAIAVFFFLMQTLWFYIDDIIGKGLGLFFIIELMAYKCVSLFPMALPLAILISCVMVMGGMAEHYELSSIKSAGVPLLRVMRPLIFVGLLASLVSYYCSATLIPLANLQFGSRMYDVQQQKPGLRLDEGIFNDDFQGFSIHIGKKGTNGTTMKDVLIYDQSENAKGQYSQISAKEGEMYTAQDGKYFVMNLKDGNQYIEVAPGGVSSNNGRYPFVRTIFKQYTKVFDMSEFALSRTNATLFKSNKSMMSIPELKEAIDSMDIRMNERAKSLEDQIQSYFLYLPKDSAFLYAKTENNLDTAAKKLPINVTDSARIAIKPSSKTTSKDSQARPALPSTYTNPEKRLSLRIDPQTGETLAVNKLQGVVKELQKRAVTKEDSIAFVQSISASVPKPAADELPDSIKRFADLYKKEEKIRLLDRAKTFALSVQNQTESTARSLLTMREQQVKYSYEMWTKYSIALVCIIFVFVGAPMGAIVRKGGFGYPILVSILFFMLFVILTIFCRKIAEAFVLPASVAAWMPAAVLFPIGLLLTIKAMNDSKFNIAEGLKRLADRFQFKRNKHDALPPQVNSIQ